MRLRNLQTFVAVARLGSFHAAAQQQHTTQPGVSARINALEEELGVQLFIRDKSGTRLSPKGVQLLPYAEKMLAIGQEMKEQLSEEQQQKGNIRIGIADTLAHLWLTRLLEHWQQQHPLLSFELNTDVSQRLIQQLSDHQLDLALIVDQPLSDTALVSEPLCSYPQKWVAAPDLITGDSVKDIEDLARYPILSFPRDTRPWEFLQSLFINRIEMPRFHTCGSVKGLLELTQQGLGIALLTAPLVDKQIASGELVELDISPNPPGLNFSFSWRLDDNRILPKLLADSGRGTISQDHTD
ncbi:LysR family transcriptional regulator [Neptuniibacter caesariensis]|uniref:Transcriptional regulator, LysR family protein n=1 Tax=Neptuniibacter caesariensis TaxID=207954 RepID=A0A7U8GSM1_NEPCE|nr:LysR family transcriptional regulator [Neptuniibacter caesariensis]EAR61541.1 transcriptional regulator, LysR family protein [Oceanospirillum sp. MED92] [Neptuniibacter caesariensis]